MQCGYFDEKYIAHLKGMQLYPNASKKSHFQYVVMYYFCFISIVYPQHSYHGLPNYQCRYCKALFWYGERIGNLSGKRTVIYNYCCKGGKVYIPPYRP
jgi:hypothetical protein